MMWNKHRAELWSYDPEVDPQSLRNLDQFGSWIFVIRNSLRQLDRAWFQINRETLAIDAGIKAMETIFNVGTGDVFIIGFGLASRLKYHISQIAALQSKLDKKINAHVDVIRLKEIWEESSRTLFSEVSFCNDIYPI